MYLSGKVRHDFPVMLTPTMGNRLPEGCTWAADNGRYSAPDRYSDDRYLSWLARWAHAADRCLFATAPDVVGDARATLALSAPMFQRIRDAGYPVALVAQDGLEDIPVPWADFDVLFIGGTTEWKLSAAVIDLVAEANRRGVWVHMGRVNSYSRLAYADAIGCDSADGTLLRFDPNRPVQAWLDRIHREPSLWRTSSIEEELRA